jgi:ABC-type multidrug transport system fused ATPase/permease subunit
LVDLHRESPEGTTPFRFQRDISFKNVSFSYEEGRPILDGIDFSIRAGETVGLIGPSGSGKTSVADLLLRLFNPSAGALLLDGVLVESIALASWRARIGYVSQDVFLLNSSIEENIRFYNKSLTREDIEHAAKQANIYEFIMGLPEGFQTATGDRGVMLSGGQRQRIVLARALAHKPSLLILDEATSALDHESEKLIHESIRALHGKVAVLIIAHRPSTVAEAYTIFVLSRGRIVERGSPHDLLKRHDSYFSKMQHA